MSHVDLLNICATSVCLVLVTKKHRLPVSRKRPVSTKFLEERDYHVKLDVSLPSAFLLSACVTLPVVTRWAVQWLMNPAVSSSTLWCVVGCESVALPTSFAWTLGQDSIPRRSRHGQIEGRVMMQPAAPGVQRSFAICMDQRVASQPTLMRGRALLIEGITRVPLCSLKVSLMSRTRSVACRSPMVSMGCLNGCLVWTQTSGLEPLPTHCLQSR